MDFPALRSSFLFQAIYLRCIFHLYGKILMQSKGYCMSFDTVAHPFYLLKFSFMLSAGTLGSGNQPVAAPPPRNLARLPGITGGYPIKLLVSYEEMACTLHGKMLNVFMPIIWPRFSELAGFTTETNSTDW
jgi:hypothetical protein